MPRIQQPVASVKLTNVATVRLTVNGQRFEIACYKNKILDYRAGLETDLSEVLQTDRIFSNVVKGEFASTADMKKAFGKNVTEEEIALIILNKGKSLQVSEAERTQLYESTLTQVATWLATNCFHKTTGKPFTMSQVKQALTSTTYSVQPHKPIKQQYLQALKHLQASDFPIQRAAMELSWTYDSDDEKKVRDILHELNITHVKPEKESNKLILTVDPSLYRPLNQKAPTNSMIEVLNQHVMGASATPDISTRSTTASNVNSPEPQPQQHELQEHGQSDSSENSATDEPYIQPSSRSKKKKGKKQQRKAERRQQRAAAQSSDESDVEPANAALEATQAVVQPPANDTPNKLKCNSCPGSSFASAAEHRTHFKTDWHRFNQKLKMKGASTVTEVEFRSCDVDSFFGDDYDH